MSSHNQFTDNELIDLIKSGDQLAFAEIYERYWAILFLHTRNLLRDDEEARDIVQDLFTHLWLQPASLIIETSVSTYLYRIVRNKTLNCIKHKKVVSIYLDSINEFSKNDPIIPDVILREKELAEIIESQISALPGKMRKVFELSRKNYLSYQQIAMQLNISENTVKSQVSNALRILRTKVGVSSIIVGWLLIHWK